MLEEAAEEGKLYNRGNFGSIQFLFRSAIQKVCDPLIDASGIYEGGSDGGAVEPPTDQLHIVHRPATGGVTGSPGLHY